MTDYLCASCNEDGMVCIPRAELDRLATAETDPDILRRMIEIERAQATEIQAKLFKVAAMAAQLNEENERLREALEEIKRLALRTKSSA